MWPLSLFHSCTYHIHACTWKAVEPSQECTSGPTAVAWSKNKRLGTSNLAYLCHVGCLTMACRVMCLIPCAKPYVTSDVNKWTCWLIWSWNHCSYPCDWRLCLVTPAVKVTKQSTVTKCNAQIRHSFVVQFVTKCNVQIRCPVVVQFCR